MDFQDALMNLWNNCPDEMELVLEEMKISREERFRSIWNAKVNGLSADWIEGEMLAYDEMKANLAQPEVPQRPALQ